MRKHCTLYPPSRSRGKKDHAGIIGRGGAGRFGRHMPAPLDLCLVEGTGKVEHATRIAALADQPRARAVGQHQFRGNLMDHRHQFGRGAAAIEQGGNTTGLDHRQEADDPFGAVAHADRHPLAPMDLEQRHQPVTQGENLLKAEPPVSAVVGFFNDEGLRSVGAGRLDHRVEIGRHRQELAQPVLFADLEGRARRGQRYEVGIKPGHAASFAKSLAQR